MPIITISSVQAGNPIEEEFKRRRAEESPTTEIDSSSISGAVVEAHVEAQGLSTQVDALAQEVATTATETGYRVRYDQAMSLTSAQQLQARQNINAASNQAVEFSTAPTLDLESGKCYHVSPTTSVVLPSVAGSQHPIKLSRDWGSVDPVATLTIDDADQIVNKFPASGDEVVQLWPFSDDSLSGWVVLASPRNQ